MKTIVINVRNLLSVDFIDDIVEICTGESNGGNMLLKITEAAWEKICERVIEDMERGASPGEEVE